jgi:hypothetical protein
VRLVKRVWSSLLGRKKAAKRKNANGQKWLGIAGDLSVS